MDDREYHTFDPRDPVHDLVHGPVSADGDEETGASGCGCAGELREVLRAFGEERVAYQAAVGREAGDLRPAPSGRAAVRGGIDEEGRAANGRRS
jgi:hypothetical protein